MFSCSLNVPETNLKSFAESRYLSGSYFILLGNDPENGNSPCSKHILSCHFSYMDCEIRHEILLAWTLGAHLIHFMSFFSWKFLNTIVCNRKCCHLGGDHDPQPSLDPPLLIMKHEVLAEIHLYF